MNRWMEKADPVKCPNMSELWNGTLQQKRDLLQNWLSSGEVAAKCEMHLKITKETEDSYDSEEQLLTMEGMKRAGISEPLGSIAVGQLQVLILQLV